MLVSPRPSSSLAAIFLQPKIQSMLGEAPETRLRMLQKQLPAYGFLEGWAPTPARIKLPSPQHTAHNLAAACLGQPWCPVDDIWGCKGANLAAYAQHELLLQLI